MGGIRINKLSYYIIHINLLLLLFGYAFTVAIFIPLTGNVAGSSTIVTIPFRAIQLSLSLLTILVAWKYKLDLTLGSKLFLIFWIAFLVRVFYDLHIRNDFNIPYYYSLRVWTGSFWLTFIPLLSILKSYPLVDLDYIRTNGYRMLFVVLVISAGTLFTYGDISERINLNIALDSISFGKTSMIFVIFIILNISQRKKYTLKYFYYLFLFAISLYVAMNSGSRGPVISFLFVIIFWYSFKSSKLNISIVKFGFLLILLYMFQSVMINIIGYISPLTAVRFEQGIAGNDLSLINRQISYEWFLDEIKQNLLFGSQFARLSNTEYPGYAHNLFLDILIGFGIPGFLYFLAILFIAFKNIRNMVFVDKAHMWYGFIFLIYFSGSLVSGAYYSTPELSFFLILVLQYNQKSKFYIKH